MCGIVGLLDPSAARPAEATDRILSAPQHVYTQRLLSSVPMPDPDRRRGLRIGSAQEPPSLVRPLGAPPRQAPLTERAPGHFVRADAA